MEAGIYKSFIKQKTATEALQDNTEECSETVESNETNSATLHLYMYWRHFLLRTLGSSVYQTAEIKTDTNPVSHGSSFIPQATRKGQIWNIA